VIAGLVEGGRRDGLKLDTVESDGVTFYIPDSCGVRCECYLCQGGVELVRLRYVVLCWAVQNSKEK
jgi:hypothetical protein